MRVVVLDSSSVVNAVVSHGSFSLYQNRTYQRWNPNPKFGNKTVREQWDVSKSPTVNLARMGLVAKPNQDVQRIHETPSTTGPNTNVVELFDIPDSDTLSKKVHPMPMDDQRYIAKGLDKFGEDYGKIFRDTRGVNPMQYTETQLRKMGARFLLLEDEQRQVDLPERMRKEKEQVQ